MPDSSDNYQLPSWPPTAINRDLWNAVMGSIGDRLTAREELEADFEALIAQGTQASLDYIQATVAPQIASLQTSIELAQEQIDQIIVDGIAPNAAKLGGQLPAYYAPASALPLKADVTYVDSELLDLATAIQLLLDQKAGATETANALSKRTRVDAAQSFTQAERGQARANIGGGVLAGFRNKIINGNFDFWQRGASAVGNGFRADRWNVFLSAGSSMLQSRIDLTDADKAAIGAQCARYGLHIVIGDTTSRAVVLQPIENVRTLSGKRATVTIWAKGSVANIPLSAQLVQSFGSGGSPSSVVSTELSLSASSPGLGMTKITAVVDVPSIAGKTFGSNENDYLGLQIQRLSGIVGNLTIARVSLVEGDATAEDDPFSPRHPQQELALCQRYFERQLVRAVSYGASSSFIQRVLAFYRVEKRAAPSASVAFSSGSLTSPTAILSSPNAAWIGYASTGAGLEGTFELTADAEL